MESWDVNHALLKAMNANPVLGLQFCGGQIAHALIMTAMLTMHPTAKPNILYILAAKLPLRHSRQQGFSLLIYLLIREAQKAKSLIWRSIPRAQHSAAIS